MPELLTFVQGLDPSIFQNLLTHMLTLQLQREMTDKTEFADFNDSSNYFLDGVVDRPAEETALLVQISQLIPTTMKHWR